VKAWDVESSRCLATFHQHTAAVTTICGGAGGMVYSGSQDGSLLLISSLTAAVQLPNQGHGAVTVVQAPEVHTMNNCETQLFVGVEAGYIQAFMHGDQGSKASCVSVFLERPARWQALAAVGDSLFSGSAEGVLLRWDIPSNKVLACYSEGGSPISALLLRTRLTVKHNVRDTVWGGRRNGQWQMWDIVSCDEVGLLHSATGCAVVAGNARKGHVYWADSVGTVYDTDISVMGAPPCTHMAKVPEGFAVRGVCHKAKLMYVVGADAEGQSVMMRWRLCHQQHAAIKYLQSGKNVMTSVAALAQRNLFATRES